MIKKLSVSGCFRALLLTVSMYGTVALAQEKAKDNGTVEGLKDAAASVSGGVKSDNWVAPATTVAKAPELSQMRRPNAQGAKDVAIQPKRTNFTSFSGKAKVTGNEMQAANKGHENDPELGILYAGAPCADCYEVLDKRTENQKYFVKKGTNGSQFLLQAGSRPLHYKDAKGNWRTVSPTLEADEAHAGVFHTVGRDVNSLIDKNVGYTSLSAGKAAFSYNRNLELVYIRPDGTEKSLGMANWASATGGDDGVSVKNIWPGIDLEISVLYDGMKTNFNINAAMPEYAGGKLLVRDHVQMSKGLKLNAQAGLLSGAVAVVDANGNEAFKIEQAIAYEKENVKATVQNLNYKTDGASILEIEIPGALLNKGASAYPVVIDPLVTGTSAVAGFTYSATFAAACITTVNVTIPAAATLTDIQTNYTYYGVATALWSQSGYGLYINGGCPYGWLNCGAAFASGIPGGTCGNTTPTSQWSTGALWGTTLGCIPAFSCSSYTLPFEIATTQDYATTAACASTYFASASNFTVTILGSAATPPTITPAGPSTLCMPSTLTLTGAPSGGTWNSSSGGVAGVVAGVVTGVSNGTTNISYTSGGCTAVNVVTVGTAPTITGAAGICFTGSPADTLDLTGAPAGGTWTSTVPTVATVPGGTPDPVRVTAVGPGTTYISYSTGTCSASVPIVVSNATGVAPSAQPTAMTFAGTTTSGTTLGFTTTTADGYLVIASTSPTLSATPVGSTVYTTGSAFGGGIVVVGSATGGTPTYTLTGLASNTKYYVFVYAFNNNCAGPQYNVVSPLTGNFSTCITAPTGLTVGTIGVNNVALSWTASLVGGGAASPINYLIYAYTNSSLTTLVPGYPIAAGSATSFTAGGLSGDVQYWFYVVPVDACGNASNVVTATTACTGTTLTIPFIETFDVSPTTGNVNPNCWSSTIASCITSGEQNNIVYGTGITSDYSTAGAYFYVFPYNGYCGGTWRYQWLVSPGFAMTAGTTYTVKYWYRTTGGTVWTQLKSQISTVGTLPAATAANMGGVPTTVNSTAGITATTWQNVTATVTPGASGTYYLGIMAQSVAGVTTFLAVDNIEVCAQPTVTVANGTAPYCTPATIDLTSTTTNATSYSWTGPGAFTSTLANPVTINSTAGTAVYSLTVVNDPISFGFGGLCSATATTTLTVNATPAALTGTFDVCVGSTTTLGETSTGGAWSIAPTTIATVSATGGVYGVAGGTAVVSYTGTGPCYATHPVTVSPGVPTLTLASGGVIPIRCVGINSSLAYTATNTPETYSLTWTGGPYPFLPNVAAGTALPPSPITIVSLAGLTPGTYTGTITVTNACGSASQPVTFNVVATPPPITGSVNICIGQTSTLADGATGGSWSSVNPGTASVGIASGIVTGNAAGTTTISYSIGVGCAVSTVATVNALPAAITGSNVVCLGGTTTLTDLSTGGTWSASNGNATVASVSTTTAVVTGLTGGVDTISYTNGSACYSTFVVTVAPAAITGGKYLCSGTTLTLSDAEAGGTWSSITGLTTVSGTGVVTGPTTGVDTIVYTLLGCTARDTVTVYQTPVAIVGTDSVCKVSNTTLTDATSGTFTWSSVTPGIATVTAGGVVHGVAVGTDTISYTLSYTGLSCAATVVVTVLPAPVVITGTLTVCQYDSTLLTDATGTGTWSSVSTGVATVDAAGEVVGVTAGTSIISYAINSCVSTAVVTVSAAPMPITGGLTICRYQNDTLEDAVPGGTWSSVSPGIATVTAFSGDSVSVHGVATGTSVISYTIGSCGTAVTVTVSAAPLPITGTLTVCEYSTTLLSDGTGAGTWSSVSPTVATVVGGTVTGVGIGTDTISYTIGTCAVTAVVTVNIAPAAITGTLTVCQGSVTTLGETVGGGTWHSGAITVATVDAFGDVTGVGVIGGTSLITDSIGNCAASVTVTVDIPATPIGGTFTVCVGGTTPLTDGVGGGTWSVSNTNATISAGGLVTGVSGGLDTVTYTTGCGLPVTQVITVNVVPTAISGPSTVCVGSTITLADAVPYGTWTSSLPGIGGIGGTTGIVTGVSQGVTNISYSTPGCAGAVGYPVTVYAAPAAITTTAPTFAVCVGSTINLADASTGGTWSASNTNASISGTGVVTGVAGGLDTITYSTGCGAPVTQVVTVNVVPTAITGVTNICVGSSYTFTDATPYGIWSSSAIGFASVGATTGIVLGVAQGTANISYSTGCGTAASYAVTVNNAPVAITTTAPTFAVCVGATINLADASTGGTWSASNTNASISGTGVVTGLAGGLDTITYSNGCGTAATQVVTVNVAPTAITGTLTVCVGSTTSLADAVPYGTWSSVSGGVATIGASTGVATGVSQGTTQISYSTGCGSAATATLTVDEAPVSIISTTTFAVCIGDTLKLSDAAWGGSWTSSSPGVGLLYLPAFDSTQVVGVANGTTTISYSNGCGAPALAFVTVNAAPAAISGTLNVCTGITETLSDATPYGTWSISSGGVATINATTGVVNTTTQGVRTISYTTGCGAPATATLSVNGAPAAIGGSFTVCVGGITTLTESATGGFWYSANTSTATVDSFGGHVTGVAQGIVNISYTNGCGAAVFATVTVNAAPAPIAGNAPICAGGTITLSDASTGGVWTGGAPVATTNALSGVVTAGLTQGTAVVTYNNTCGTQATVTITVNASPAPITGTASVCVGSTTTLGETSTGGTWTSGTTTVATIDPTGVVTGIAQGTSIITYANGCGTAQYLTVTVNTAPAAITGSLTACAGTSATLSNTSTGGNWTSGTTSVATIGATTGIYNATTQGTTVINYTTGCGAPATATLTVNAAPVAITGTLTVCATANTTLADASTGGTWTSGTPGVATIGASSGIVTGVAAGTTIITYANSCGPQVTAVVTVNIPPAPITGNSAMCTSGSSITLADAVSGGSWSGGSLPIATVGATGIVTPHATQGTTVISYNTGCGTPATVTVTVNEAPTVITGTFVVCAGGSVVTLLDSATGGTWSGGTAGLATIGATTGIVTTAGSIAGTAIFTYTNGCGASKTATVTINPLPVTPVPITGTFTVCIGDSVTLSDGTPGGTWSSVFPAKATITALGVVHAISGGIDTIKYTETNGCGTARAVAPITIYPLPVAGTIVGPTSICKTSGAVTFTDTSAGGTWSTSNISKLTIGGSTGIATPLALGAVTVIYTVPSTHGCAPAITTLSVSVDTFPTTPGAIVGITTFCEGSTITLTDTSAGFKWSSSDTSVAKVDSVTGIVTGRSGGSATISYTNTNACGSAYQTITDTVKPLPVSPSPISGINHVCNGLTDTLSDTLSTGFWTSSDTTKATISSAGVVSWVSPGTVIISYSDTNSCGSRVVRDTISIVPIPNAGVITGTALVCVGSATTFSDSVAGGVWSIGDTTVAQINAGTGVVTGVDSGKTVITYTYTNVCGSAYVVDSITVHPAPYAGTISGTSALCVGNFRLFTDSVSGGTWSSSASGIVNIDIHTGFATAVSVGTAVVSYSVVYVCGVAVAKDTVTVYPLPHAGTITGKDTLCVGSTITLMDTASGGVWSATNGDALVSDSGVVTGIVGGIDTIHYTVSSVGCGAAVASYVITLNPLATPGLISGSPYACIGARDSLYSSMAGGSWSITNGHATISPTGVVNGLTTGLDTAVYTVHNSCGTASGTFPLNVHLQANAGTITGVDSVCVLATITVSDITTGGVWGATNGNATISGGVVTGAVAGVDTILYMVTNVCGTDSAMKTIIVDPLLDPGVITGINVFCQYTKDSLVDTTAGGVWSSATGKSSITTSGMVTGNLYGADTIEYSLTNSCGVFSAKFPVTINPAPNAGTIYNTDPVAALMAGTSVCIGSTITIHDSLAGGTWHITNTNASFNFSTGLVSGLVVGLDTIYYTVSNMCGSDTALDTFHIYPLPSIPAITGHHVLCTGVSDTLNIPYLGGTWTNGDSLVAMPYGHTSGTFYFNTLTAGIDTVYYSSKSTPGCKSTVKFPITVIDTPNFKISPTSTDLVCYNQKIGTITLNLTPDTAHQAIGVIKYEWSNNATTQNLDSLGAGTYSVVILDPSTKCRRTDSFTITQPDSLDVRVTVKNDTCKTGNGALWVAVSGGVGPYKYLWSSYSTDTFLLGLSPAAFWIQITDSNQCVKKLDVDVLEGICNDIVVHNALTPNGDGVNDIWIIDGIDDYPANSVQIFDKWGDVVFQKDHYDNTWGGKGNNGLPLPAGTYFYIVKLNTVNASGASNVKTGSMLIKY